MNLFERKAVNMNKKELYNIWKREEEVARREKMNILVIGGTRYFGTHMVNKLLEQGHDITIATRGKNT